MVRPLNGEQQGAAATLARAQGRALLQSGAEGWRAGRCQPPSGPGSTPPRSPCIPHSPLVFCWPVHHDASPQHLCTVPLLRLDCCCCGRGATAGCRAGGWRWLALVRRPCCLLSVLCLSTAALLPLLLPLLLLLPPLLPPPLLLLLLLHLPPVLLPPLHHLLPLLPPLLLLLLLLRYKQQRVVATRQRGLPRRGPAAAVPAAPAVPRPARARQRRNRVRRARQLSYLPAVSHLLQRFLGLLRGGQRGTGRKQS